ncbi:MAG: hypothetical protein J1F66_03625 [Clostridiales bacterium]|nr:hypothetical protein [Clostridiales bacterium]
MKQTTRRILFDILQIAVLIVVVIVLWYVVALIFHSELILPQPHNVLKITFSLLARPATYLALLYTLLRAVAAFILSVGFAILLALCVGVYDKSAFYVNAIVTFLRALPTIAIILITLILFNSAITPVIVAFLVTFPIVYSVFQREFVRNEKLLQVCKVYEVKVGKKIKYALFPLIQDELLTLVKDNLPLCIKIVVAGEALALPLYGIGRQMYVAKVNLETANVVALTILTLIVCFALSSIVSLCQRKKI